MEAIQTDHRAVIWKVQAPLEVIKGPGVWKFNDKFLNEDEFCQQVIEIIRECEDSPAPDAIKNWINFKVKIANMA